MTNFCISVEKYYSDKDAIENDEGDTDDLWIKTE